MTRSGNHPAPCILRFCRIQVIVHLTSLLIKSCEIGFLQGFGLTADALFSSGMSLIGVNVVFEVVKAV